MLHSIVTLIVDALASALAGILLLRFWMQAIRVRPPASVAQFLFQLTDWLIKPLRRLIPGFGGLDWASLLGAYLVILLSIVIDLALAGALPLELALLLALLRMVQWSLFGLTGLIVIEVIFSWVNPNAPLAPFVRALNEPLMRPLRRVIPLIGNIDLSPLAALILLQIAQRLVGALMLSL